MNQKPEDVDQGAWDAAESAIKASCIHPSLYWVVKERIARAIMAAEQRGAEREAARLADWADATADHYDAEAVAGAIRGIAPNRAAERALMGFAAAIRSRAEEAMP